MPCQMIQSSVVPSAQITREGARLRLRLILEVKTRYSGLFLLSAHSVTWTREELSRVSHAEDAMWAGAMGRKVEVGELRKRMWGRIEPR